MPPEHACFTFPWAECVWRSDMIRIFPKLGSLRPFRHMGSEWGLGRCMKALILLGAFGLFVYSRLNDLAENLVTESLMKVDLHPTQSLNLIFTIWPHTFSRWRWYKSWAGLLRVQFHPSSRPGRSSSLHLFLSSFSPFFDPDLLLCSSAETSSSPVDIPHLLFCLHHPPWPHLHPPHQYPLPLLFALLHPPQIFPIPLSSQPNSSLFFWPTLPSLISPLLTSPFQSSTLPPPLPAPHLTTPTTNQSTGRKVKTRSCHKIQNMLVQNWEQTIFFVSSRTNKQLLGFPPWWALKGQSLWCLKLRGDKTKHIFVEILRVFLQLGELQWAQALFGEMNSQNDGVGTLKWEKDRTIEIEVLLKSVSL